MGDMITQKNPNLQVDHLTQQICYQGLLIQINTKKNEETKYFFKRNNL